MWINTSFIYKKRNIKEFIITLYIIMIDISNNIVHFFEIYDRNSCFAETT